MVVVKIELHSANTSEITEIGRMIIANDDTGTDTKGNYDIRLGRKGNTDNSKIWSKPVRNGQVTGYNRVSDSAWILVLKAIKALGFNE